MATVKNIGRSICDDAFSELEHVKERIVSLRDRLTRDYAGEEKVLAVYDRHLTELVEQIEWRLQILSHSCSYGWKGSDEYDERGDNTVSVGPAGKANEDFSPGYLGG